jgi:hypothetical protein
LRDRRGRIKRGETKTKRRRKRNPSQNHKMENLERKNKCKIQKRIRMRL